MVLEVAYNPEAPGYGTETRAQVRKRLRVGHGTTSENTAALLKAPPTATEAWAFIRKLLKARATRLRAAPLLRLRAAPLLTVAKGLLRYQDRGFTMRLRPEAVGLRAQDLYGVTVVLLDVQSWL